MSVGVLFVGVSAVASTSKVQSGGVLRTVLLFPHKSTGLPVLVGDSYGPAKRFGVGLSWTYDNPLGFGPKHLSLLGIKVF